MKKGIPAGTGIPSIQATLHEVQQPDTRNSSSRWAKARESYFFFCAEITTAITDTIRLENINIKTTTSYRLTISVTSPQEEVAAAHPAYVVVYPFILT
ncbi:hypothetical protein [Siminovitchia fortis]|uniref:hypothetical protein n=1 Tax=Siminovitchia fortis TaxID=254758 RepID=UPI00119F4C10|nr:hypothetical protein [Siminovitchia fortis]